MKGAASTEFEGVTCEETVCLNIDVALSVLNGLQDGEL